MVELGMGSRIIARYSDIDECSVVIKKQHRVLREIQGIGWFVVDQSIFH